MSHNPIAKDQNKGNVVVSWTGGKDGCFACYKTISEGYNITHLLSFRNIKRKGAHEINPDLLFAQSEAIGIPIVQRDFISYEEEFKKVVRNLRENGFEINGAAFGHIGTHKPLADRICSDMEIQLLLPIWNQDSGKILTEIIEAGFEAIIVSVNADMLDKEWLGRKIDDKFMEDLRDLNASIDPCGENGEFHTFVIDGPIFRGKLKILETEIVSNEDHWFLNISDFDIEEK